VLVQACQTTLPVVDGPAQNTSATTAQSQAGSAAPAGAAAPANAAPRACTSSQTPELIRTSTSGHSAGNVLVSGNTLFFLETSASDDASGTQVVKSMDVTGGNEQTLFAPDPPAHITRMMAHGDTLYFMVQPDAGADLYGLAKTGGTPHSYAHFAETRQPVVATVDDQSAFVWDGEYFAARVTLADGTVTRLPYAENTKSGDAMVFNNHLWFIVLEGTSTIGHGIFSIDLTDPTLTAVQASRHICQGTWKITDSGVFCADSDRITRFDPTSTTSDLDNEELYNTFKDLGFNYSLYLNGPDGEYLYATPSVHSDHKSYPIVRFNFHNHQSQTVACDRQNIGTIAFDETHLYWGEGRTSDGGNVQGIYRLAKP
jgi:hypothetical protein